MATTVPKAIPFARHTGYTSGGKPVVTTVPPLECAADTDTTVGGRQIDYDSTGRPKLAMPWGCCDNFCPDPEPDCNKELTCWPPGPGITNKVFVYPLQNNCMLKYFSPYFVLDYDAGTGKWTGTITFPGGGTITLTFECDPLEAVGSARKFQLTYTVICPPLSTPVTGSIRAGYRCQDPLVVSFSLTGLDIANCCCPPLGGSVLFGTVHVVANCRRTVQARHVTYTAAGVPVVAQSANCNNVRPPVCCQNIPNFPDTLHGTITDVVITPGSGCDQNDPCWSATYKFVCAYNDPHAPAVVSYVLSDPSFICPLTACANGGFAIKCTVQGDGSSLWTTGGAVSSSLVSVSCDPFELVFLIGVSGLGTYTLVVTL